jgi:hypothetical protein
MNLYYLNFIVLLCTISIVHNDGLRGMAQRVSYDICYHLTKQANWPFAMDACGKLENVGRKVKMVAKRVHRWWCQCKD